MLDKSMFKKPNLALEGEKEPGRGRGDGESAPSIPLWKRLNRRAAAQARAGGGALTACPGCKATLLLSELEGLLYVCPECGRHLRMDGRARIRLIADEGSFAEMDAALCAGNILGFGAYDEKLAAAREESREPEAVLTGLCRIGGAQTAIFAMNPLFMMGSMGTVVGEKITRLFECATERALPVVGFTLSGGARVQEGILSLMQMAKTSGAVLRHSRAGLFYLTVLTDPTTGGVTASFAMEGDIILSEPGALIGFAGPRVIQQTMRQTLPEGFQRAEFLLKKGFVDSIVPRKEQKTVIARLLELHEGRKEHESV